MSARIARVFRIGRIRRGKYKWYGCRKEWGSRRENILEGLRVPVVRVLIAIKLFALETSVREAAHQLGLAYNIVYDIRPVPAINCQDG
jgi:hypothetical protein